jgi:hypothetical protein
MGAAFTPRTETANMTTPDHYTNKRRELLTPIDLAKFLLIRYTGHSVPAKNSFPGATQAQDSGKSKSTLQ